MMARSYAAAAAAGDALDKMAHISVSGVVHEREESTEDAHIYLRAETSDGSLCHWYVMKKLEDTRHKRMDELEFLPRVFDDTMKFKERSACVAMGSLIYVIGGFQRTIHPKYYSRIQKAPDVTNEVYCIDTLRPENGWTRAPSMLRPRCDSYSITLDDGGIYVLGSFPLDSDPELPNYAEVFFPSRENSCWRPVFHNIPKTIVDGGRVFAHQITVTKEQRQQLLVYNVVPRLGSLYSYNFDDKSWDSYFDGDFGPKCATCVTILDDIMYCYDCATEDEDGEEEAESQEDEEDLLYSAPGSILAFDVKNPKSPPKRVRGLEEENDFLPRPGYLGHFPTGTFLHLGDGKLCLVLHEYFESRGLLITFLKFKVSKVPNLLGEVEDLVASHMCKSSCFVDAKYLNNLIAMPAFGGRGETKEDIRGKPSDDARTASLATINNINEEGGSNASVDVKMMKGKKKKKHPKRRN